MGRMLCIISIIAAAVLAGCSQNARHRLWNWFFEVPPAGEIPAEADATAPEPEPPAELALSAKAYQSHHPPFVRRECAACHDAGSRMQVRTDYLAACKNCHEKYFGDDVYHEPVKAGDCKLCHQPHRSVHPGLLRMGIRALCLDCHDEDDVEEAHGEMPEDCGECHDAHFD